MTRKVEEAWPVRVLSKTGGGGGVGWGIGDALLEFGIGTPIIHLPHLKPKALPVLSQTWGSLF